MRSHRWTALARVWDYLLGDTPAPKPRPHPLAFEALEAREVPATISGTVYREVNGIFGFNGTDFGVVGDQVVLRSFTNGFPVLATTTSGPGGAYQFTGVDPSTTTNGAFIVELYDAIGTSLYQSTVAVIPPGSPGATGVNLVDGRPGVTVAKLADATEGGSAGTFRFTRTGSTSAAQTVTYSVGGTATSGTDFTSLSGTVTFAAGASTADVTVTAIDDVSTDAGETVTVTIGTGTGYAVGTPSTASLTIADDEAAPNYWIGGTGGSWTNPANWSNGVPTSTSALYFDGTHSNASVTIPDGESGTSSFAELHLVGGYTGTVTLSNNVTVRNLELTSGTLDQPATAYGTDLTVTAALLWTGGTLNSTSNPAALHISGAVATIDPGVNNTISTGSTLSFESGARGVIRNGTVASTLDTDIIVGENSSLLTEDVVLTSAQIAPSPIPVEDGATYTAKGLTSARGLSVEKGGTVFVGGGKTSKFSGRANPATGESVWVQKDAVALVIENGSTLDSPRGVTIVGGTTKLVTQAINTPGNQPAATIKTGILVTGADVSISDVAYNPAGVTGHKFGISKIDGTGTLDGGNIIWGDGTYRPVVDGTTGSGTADLWTCTGEFTVFGKDDGAFAKIAPVSINNPAGGIVGRSWVVMHSDDKVTWLDGEESPKLSTGWVNDSVKNDKDWKVKYTG